MDNLSLYNKLRTVPEEAKKPISAGRLKGMTDINPVWRIKALTEAFGPCGVGWWYTVDRKEIVRDPLTDQGAAFVDITLYYIDPESGAESHGIPGTGGASFVAKEKNGPYMSDECYKMALTDAISVAAKSLGLAADVYFARGCSETKYAGNGGAAGSPGQSFQRAEPVEPIHYCEDCTLPIKGCKRKDGSLLTAAEFAANTKAVYGRQLCADCEKKARAARSGGVV